MNEAHMLHVLRVAKNIRDQKLYFRQDTWFHTDAGRLTPSDLGGHMCFDREFQRLGLRVGMGSYALPLFGPKGDEWMAEDALAELLGLNEVEAKFLFGTVDEVCLIDDRLQPELVSSSIANCVWRVERVNSAEFAAHGSWTAFRFG